MLFRSQAVTEELSAGRVERAAKMARKHMPGKAADAFNKAADKFYEAIEDYAEQVRGDVTKSGRLEEIPSILEAPIRAIKDGAAAVIALIKADSEVVDIDSLAERARVQGATQEVLTTVNKILKPVGSQVLWFEQTFSTLYLAPLEVSNVLRENRSEEHTSELQSH